MTRWSVMKVLGVGKLIELSRRHADAEAALFSWLNEARSATWRTPHDVLARYPTASLLGGTRGIIFNIRGNRYRLHVRVAWKTGVVTIEQVGTHEEYDQWEI